MLGPKTQVKPQLVGITLFVSETGFLPAWLPVLRENQPGFLSFGNLEVWQWITNKHTHMAES